MVHNESDGGRGGSLRNIIEHSIRMRTERAQNKHRGKRKKERGGGEREYARVIFIRSA